MTLLAQIKALDPALLTTRNTDAIAAAVSVGRVSIQSRLIGIGTILATLGAAGGQFLDGLVAIGATDRNVFWAMELIKAGTLDIGMPATRAQVSALAIASPAVAPAVSALLALAEVPDPVTELQVRCVLWDVSGNWLGG
jgi:hypothetical protein